MQGKDSPTGFEPAGAVSANRSANPAMNFPPLIARVFDESDADARRVSREIEAIRTRFERESVGDTLAREKIRARTSPSTSRLGRACAAMFIAPLPDNYVAHADRNADFRRVRSQLATNRVRFPIHT
jgi:hypothetical protein